VSWQLVYTKQAQKDAKPLTQSNLREKAQALLDIIEMSHEPIKYQILQSID
jgi:toxin YoeB